MLTPPRNRLAKALPDRWRETLLEEGVPRRKYTAVLKLTLDTGEIVEPVVVEEGWIISVGLDALAADAFEQRIDLDPSTITAIEVLQIV